MTQPRILTLLTDFGLSDPYVGVMKGTIAQINPHLSVIDLTHQIPPQKIGMARFALMSAFPYFPAETVHVAVVDPGVGSSRRAIAVAVGTDPSQPIGFLVGPDNGLFSGVLSQHPVIAAVELSNSQYWRTAELSQTFHGRDLFAPVGAHLASGVALAELGHPIAPETLIQWQLPNCSTDQWDQARQKITGFLQAIDHFGNLITNIPGDRVAGKPWHIIVNGITIPGQQTYADQPIGTLVALIGSHGWVEIAVNGGNAEARLLLDWGKPVQVIVEANSNDTAGC